MAAANVRIVIRKVGGKVVFDPASAPANTGDDIFWLNEDVQQHWPTPTAAAGSPEAWELDNAIPGTVAGADPASSDSVSYPAGVSGPQSYFCALHRSETGVIDVTD
jgi:plastocyanin